MSGNLSLFLHHRQLHPPLTGWAQCSPPMDVLNSIECSQTDILTLNDVPPYAVDFHPSYRQGSLAAVVDEEGWLRLLDTSLDLINPRSQLMCWSCHNNAVFDVKWIPHREQLLTASGDRSVKLHDASESICVRTFDGHTSSVKSVSCRDSYVFATASRDGSMRLWDTRCVGSVSVVRGLESGCVEKIAGCHMDERRPIARRRRGESVFDAQSVTCVLFQGEYSLISCGSTDGNIKLWDIRNLQTRGRTTRPTPVSTYQYKGTSRKKIGFSHLSLDTSRTRLFAYCRDDILYQYNLNSSSLRPTVLYKGHKASSFYIRTGVSPCGNYVVCGSGCGSAWIYAVGVQEQRPVRLECGSGSEVTVPLWCRVDPGRILTLGDDCTVRIWRHLRQRHHLMPLTERSHLDAIGCRSQTASVTIEDQESLLLTTPQFKRVRNKSGRTGSIDGDCSLTRQVNIQQFLNMSRKRAPGFTVAFTSPQKKLKKLSPPLTLPVSKHVDTGTPVRAQKRILFEKMENAVTEPPSKKMRTRLRTWKRAKLENSSPLQMSDVDVQKMRSPTASARMTSRTPRTPRNKSRRGAGDNSPLITDFFKPDDTP